MLTVIARCTPICFIPVDLLRQMSWRERERESSSNLDSLAAALLGLATPFSPVYGGAFEKQASSEQWNEGFAIMNRVAALLFQTLRAEAVTERFILKPF